MTLIIHQAGLQTTIQAQPRSAYRHMGVPSSGAADPLSLALANHLVGNTYYSAGLEINFGTIKIEFQKPCAFALTGTIAPALLNGQDCPYHQTVTAQSGSVLTLAFPPLGVRTYLGIAGGLNASEFLGSHSTYMTAQFGGHNGRALQNGDVLHCKNPSVNVPILRTPDKLKPFIAHTTLLGVCLSAESHLLTPSSQTTLFDQTYSISKRGNRMGIQLEGKPLSLNSDGTLKSAPVFPGTIQCPEDGIPFILMADAQTTGGYPRIAQVIRAHRHRLGQLRINDKIQFQHFTPDEAFTTLEQKANYLQQWLPEFGLY